MLSNAKRPVKPETKKIHTFKLIEDVFESQDEVLRTYIRVYLSYCRLSSSLKLLM